MKIDILTIFPKQIESFLSEGIFRIAKSKELAQINVHDLRDWAEDKHKSVDDSPFGGGAGMVMKVEPIFNALKELRGENTKVIVTTPRGRRYDQKYAQELSEDPSAHYIIICGHYEGIDERVHEKLADIEISIGDYVLSGGELPSLVIIDSILRLIPGVLGNADSALNDSFSDGLLEYPQYTRPAEFNGWNVPDILISGDHEKVKKWREEQSIITTRKNRGDIVKK